MFLPWVVLCRNWVHTYGVAWEPMLHRAQSSRVTAFFRGALGAIV